MINDAAARIFSQAKYTFMRIVPLMQSPEFVVVLLHWQKFRVARMTSSQPIQRQVNQPEMRGEIKKVSC